MAEKIVKDSQGLAKDLVNDTISRRAAVDMILGQPIELHYPSWYAEQIKTLPSAQPYTDAEIQKIQDLEQTQFEKMYELGYQAGCAAQPEQRWIPCDKGEPDEDMECWVTVKTTDALYRGNFTKRYGERRDKGFITSGGFMWWNTALAWMPIYEPEPYKGGEDE